MFSLEKNFVREQIKIFSELSNKLLETNQNYSQLNNRIKNIKILIEYVNKMAILFQNKLPKKMSSISDFLLKLWNYMNEESSSNNILEDLDKRFTKLQELKFDIESNLVVNSESGEEKNSLIENENKEKQKKNKENLKNKNKKKDSDKIIQRFGKIVLFDEEG